MKDKESRSEVKREESRSEVKRGKVKKGRGKRINKIEEGKR